MRSRFAQRLDLQGSYSTRHEAEQQAIEITRRLFHGQLHVFEVEHVAVVQGHRVHGKAKFRADIHRWEPVLMIEEFAHGKPVRRHAWSEGNSPFYRHTFDTAELAARFAVWYGERMVRSLVPGFDRRSAHRTRDGE